MLKLDKVKTSFVVTQIIKSIVAIVFIAVFVLFFTSFFSDVFYYITSPKPIYEFPDTLSRKFLDLSIRVIYVSILGFIFAHVYRDDELIPVIVPPSVLSIFFYKYFIYDILDKFFALIECNSDFVAFLSMHMSFSKIFFIPYLVIFMISAAFVHKVLNKNKSKA